MAANEPRDVEHDPDEHNGEQEIPEGVAVFVARHVPVNEFVADDCDHRDGQPDPPIFDQSLPQRIASSDRRRASAAAAAPGEVRRR
jgi:hypothetical protein